tara:strand:- start:315 stop:896 length:582 start_codon:yes stop_codon:yes gene_type:complete
MWKSNHIKSIFTLYIYLSLVLSCQQVYQDPINPQYEDPEKDLFININKNIYKSEELKIDSLMETISLPFFKDKTGVRIYIEPNNYNRFTSLYPKDGSVVTIGYNCFSLIEYVTQALDSNQNYHFSDFVMDTIQFTVGYSKQMRGLTYSIKLLEVGDKAKIVIPSYLGFGMSGYFDKVKPYETLILNVELLNIK